GSLGLSDSLVLDTVTHAGTVGHLMDLDASELEISLDLEAVDVIGVDAMGERAVRLAVNTDLQALGLVGDVQIEAHSLLEGHLRSLLLLIAPLVLRERVANTSLLVEVGAEHHGDIAVLAEEIEVESLSLLLHGSGHMETLTDGESARDSSLVGNGLVLSSPVDVIEVEVSIDGEMGDGKERESVLEVTELLLIDHDLELLIVCTDTDVKWFALLDRAGLALLLAPLAVAEGVHDDLALIEADGHVERYVVAGEVGGVGVEVDHDSAKGQDRASLDGQGLAGLDLLLEHRTVGHG
ncbi:hypothetical protein PENTCL1PPCAC_7786, partial [Pristionchus entomophagus]